MKVLINRTDAIGDCLLTTPLARLIKEKHPDAEVHFLVSPRSGDLISLCEGVDNIAIYDPMWSFWKRWSFLKTLFSKENYDAFFHLGGRFLPMVVAFFQRVSFRGGLQSKWASFFFLNKGIRQSRRLVTMHESDYNMALACKLNITVSGKRPIQYAPSLNVSKEEAQSALDELNLKINGRRLIIIHPGMSGHTLNWASRNYGRFIDRLYQSSPDSFYFLISYTPSDGPYLEGIRDYLEQHQQSASSVHFFNGAERGILFYTKLLKAADLFIGPSTGTSHMANALGVDQIALFSPIKVQSSHRWGPYIRNERVKVVVPDVVCGESTVCAGSSCPYYECMSKIEVDEVFEAAKELLQTKE